MALLVVSVVFSLALIWAVNACARSADWGIAGACTLSAVLTTVSGLFVCLAFPAFSLQAALTFVFLLVCIPFRHKPRVIRFAPIAAMAASYGFFLWQAVADVQNVAQLRAKYPLVSVADRLAYETRITDIAAPSEAGSGPLALSSVVEQRLAEREDRRTRTELPWRHNRRTMLASLHTRKADEFAIAQGFGRGRMMPGFVSEAVIELPPAEPTALPSEPEPPYRPEDGSTDELVDAEKSALPQTNNGTLISLHESGTADFVDPDRIGYARDRDHVAGFIAHRFTKMPDFSEYGKQTPAWQIARLELVSLLKHDVPVAYVSNHLPQMDELRDAPTRPLDEFERTSLDLLVSEEDVVIDETPDRIRMIGSLRADKNCLKCHAVQRGALLGALTYELVPEGANRRKAGSVAGPSS